MLCSIFRAPPAGNRRALFRTTVCLLTLTAVGCRHLAPVGAPSSDPRSEYTATYDALDESIDEHGSAPVERPWTVEAPQPPDASGASPETPPREPFFAFDPVEPFGTSDLPGTTEGGAILDVDDASLDDLLVADGPPCISSLDDLKTLLPTLWADACSVVTWESAVILGIAAGGAVAIRDNLDGDVRAYTVDKPLRWGEGTEVLRQFGEFTWQVPIIAGAYAWSVFAQNEKLHEFSKALISAYGITAIATVTIKGITDTQRPTHQFEDGRYGFPSYHAASTFAIASVIDEYYGWPLGIPSYIMAGLVGWTRIDQREHDLGDVFFGSVLGFVIGKSIAAAHLERYGNCRIYPYCDPLVRGLGFTICTTY